MNIWFVRSNGHTAHNNPNSLEYVSGEPPMFPLREFNYRKKCLQDGFARIGWPNTGDLTEENPVRLAPQGYSLHSIEPNHQRYLEQFKNIKAGDLILIPADEERGEVHLGIVLTKEKQKIPPYIEPRPIAYYYYFDIEKGDWYDCAHRVNVHWAKENENEFLAIHSDEIEKPYIWNLAFALVKYDETIYHLAQKNKLF